MNQDLEALDGAVVDAALAGDLDQVADAKVRRAAARIHAGELALGADDLGDAAAIHRAAGRTLDESRVRQAMATALRGAGRVDEAVEAAAEARALAPAGTPFAVAAATEHGEGLLFAGRPAEAVAAYAAALEHGAAAGLVDAARAALTRRMALARSVAGDQVGAAAAMAEAAALFGGAGDARAARRVRLEEASALVAAGLGGAARQRMDAVRDEAAADPAILAELELLECADALTRRAPAEALAHAQAARRHALAGGAVLPYVGAALAIAEVLEQGGDLVGAYGSLAVGWVSAQERVDGVLAAALFRPALAGLRERLGAARFDEVKAAFEATRPPG